MTSAVQVRRDTYKSGILNSRAEFMVGRCLAIQHRLNPLHVYCRFRDRGLSDKLSVSICRTYESLVFVWINLIIKSMIYLCCITSRYDGIFEKREKR